MSAASLHHLLSAATSLDELGWRAIAEACVRQPAAGDVSAIVGFISERGVGDAEAVALARAIAGDPDRVMDETRPVVALLSTPGVGDKAPLVLASLISSLGVSVPIAGITASTHHSGTLEKLESIPGCVTATSLGVARAQLLESGCTVAAVGSPFGEAESDMAVLVRQLIRSSSAPLRAAVMVGTAMRFSARALVADGKWRAPLSPQGEELPGLGRAIVGIGEALGCNALAIETTNDAPLGRAVGHCLEM
jgi:thymidine phosphorylase